MKKLLLTLGITASLMFSSMLAIAQNMQPGGALSEDQLCNVDTKTCVQLNSKNTGTSMEMLKKHCKAHFCVLHKPKGPFRKTHPPLKICPADQSCEELNSEDFNQAIGAGQLDNLCKGEYTCRLQLKPLSQ